jgi:IMP dehydrogenase
MELNKALTFDDVLLVPKKSSHLPAQSITKSYLTNNICLGIPIISAAMDTVSDYKLAIAIAQLGGIACIHKNMTIEEQSTQIKNVKKFESGMVIDPITIGPNENISSAINLMTIHKISGIPVVDSNKKLVGIITNRDLRFAKDSKTKVRDLMTKKVITVNQGVKSEVAKKLLHKHRIEKLVVVDKKYQCVGLITVKDLEKSQLYPDASKDSKQSLMVAGAIGVGSEGVVRAENLIEAGVDALILDTAHGHSESVQSTLKIIKKKFKIKNLIVGNVATAEAAKELADLGADSIKVGIGPGSICTTRVVAGVGVPQFTAIQNVASGLKNYKVRIIADGGIRYSGDIAKAIGAGADIVMIGSLFAGTDEAPGEMFYYQGRSYKSYRGMGSLAAMARGSADRYFQQDIKDTFKLVPEGIEGRVPYRGPVKNIINQLVGGLKSSMGYIGAKTIEELKKKATFVEITNSGLKESHVHDVQITKQSPNYPIEN